MATLRQVLLGFVALFVFVAWNAADTAAKVAPAVKGGRLTGAWQGEYFYPDGSGQDSVKFDLVLVQEGDVVVGFMKEPNTFGNQGEPNLHALVKGRFDEKEGKLTFTKTYDGTAGQSHDVEYVATLPKGAHKCEGTWTLGNNLSGKVTLEKPAKKHAGAVSGVWKGKYNHPQGSGKDPVEIHVIMIQDGQNLTGWTKEPNTFGNNQNEPWLHASIRGQIDNSGKLTFTSTYDGTSGVDRKVACTGQLPKSGRKIDGSWRVDDARGTFSLERLTLDEKTVGNLK